VGPVRVYRGLYQVKNFTILPICAKTYIPSDDVEFREGVKANDLAKGNYAERVRK